MLQPVRPDMHQYGLREVEKLLRLPRSTIRTFIEAGFVSPSRGPRNAWRFSFQDLIVLRTAQALAAARISHQRITRSVKELRRHLPESMPLSGLSIGAVGDRVVVKEGARRWQAESGQYLLAFDGDPDAGSLTILERRDGVDEQDERAPSGKSSEALEWFHKAIGVEQRDIAAAARAYERAIALDPALADARLNLGRLLHNTSRHSEAERVYREAIEAGPPDAMLYYNLGVLLEDMKRTGDAMEAYRGALGIDPDLADCHYNLALLYEDSGKAREAIRHMARYSKLTEKA